jgi:tetratricopeptide (TPR) repeat protein
MNKDARAYEEEAYSDFSQQKFEEAFKSYRAAAQIYRSQANHKQAALCFSLAAGCWSRRQGEKPFHHAALAYEEAGREASLCQDWEYASLMYKYAALNYERDGEFTNSAESFYRCRECYRKFLFLRLLFPQKIHSIAKSQEPAGIKGLVHRVFSYLTLTFSYLVWGHGERPARTFYAGIFIILFSALFYIQGGLFKEGLVFKPHFFEALYFSVVTFTTVGFGDITAVGISRLLVMLEAMSGIFIMPLFVIALSRKYLRV